MRPLRNIVRFWLGVQALGLLISVSSVCIVLWAPERMFPGLDLTEVNLNYWLCASLLMTAVDSVSAIAWWTLRNGEPSARPWAIAASVLSLPFPVLSQLRTLNVFTNLIHFPEGLLGALVGSAGLIAFWGRDASAPVLRSVRKAEAKNGQARPQAYLVQGVSVAIIWISLRWWSDWAAFHQLPYPFLIVLIVQVQIAILLATFAHELGHLFAGWASGKILRSFRAGPFIWKIRGRKWKFNFRIRQFYGGAVVMASPDLRDMRSRSAFFLMGGPAASLTVGSLCLIAALSAVNHAWEPYWNLLSLVATFSISALLLNLIPQSPESQYSDATRIYQIAANGPWTRVELAFAMVETSTVSSLRPRDFEINLLHEAADLLPEGERGLLLRLFSCRHYLDRNRIPEALATLDAAESLYEKCKPENPSAICAEFAFVTAFYKRDVEAADRWWDRIEALRNVDQDSDYWKARAALLWIKGEREPARKAWDRGFALAQKLPPSGAVHAARQSFARLREAIEEPSGDSLQTLAAREA